MRSTRAMILLVLWAGSISAAQHSPQMNRSSDDRGRLPGAAVAAMQKIDPERIRAHVQFLAHDLLEGRGTGQRGGELAAEYMATQFALAGLKPAGDDGTFLQKVPLVGLTPLPETTFSLVPEKGPALDLQPLDQYVAYDQTQQPAPRWMPKWFTLAMVSKLRSTNGMTTRERMSGAKFCSC